MKQYTINLIAVLCLTALLFTGCGSNTASNAETAATETAMIETTESITTDSETNESVTTDSPVATADEMTTPEDVVEEWMQPITGNQIQDGVYDIKVDSSSSMFNIVDCQLLVQEYGSRPRVIGRTGLRRLKRACAILSPAIGI